MVNSKRKGNRGEREVVKLLKEWWGGEFIRNLESGGLSTMLEGVAPQDVVGRLAGDIMTPADFPFCVEVKTYANIDIWGLIRSPEKNQIRDWWEQCCNDASRAQKHPLLFMKEDRKKWHVVVRAGMVKCKEGFFITEIGYDTVLITTWERFKDAYDSLHPR